MVIDNKTRELLRLYEHDSAAFVDRHYKATGIPPGLLPWPIGTPVAELIKTIIEAEARRN